MAAATVKLADLATLVIDHDHFMRGLVVQMLRGFEMEEPAIAASGAAAKVWLANNAVDLVICEARLTDMSSAALIHWIRRCGPLPTRPVPVLVLTGHASPQIVTEARDSGASIVVRKPLSARVLHEHLLWAAQSQRPFVHTGHYVGPDRRFRSATIPAYAERRLSEEQLALMETGGEGTDARIREHIEAIEAILALAGEQVLDAAIRRRILGHSAEILSLARAYPHLATVARGLCDTATGLSPQHEKGRAPIAVYLHALQLLAPGQAALSGTAADRVLAALARMLHHLGVDGAGADPAPIHASAAPAE